MVEDQTAQSQRGASREAPETVRQMFEEIAGRYDLANRLLSGGMDHLWRRRAAELVAGWKHGRILDLATGSGDLALAVAAACPEAGVVGADFCEAMLEHARLKGLRETVVADGCALPFPDSSFDVVTVGFGLRNMESWERALGEMRRVLKPGGRVLVLDFAMPPGALRWLYRPYLHHVLPRLAGWITGRPEAYRYLGESIEQFPSGERMQRLLEQTGYGEVSWEFLTGGVVGLYSGRKV
jgi:demethylmenaquinone methyltransferase/2-methoxy-6-polyprenyl-1,4-benzoquinol methylase